MKGDQDRMTAAAFLERFAGSKVARKAKIRLGVKEPNRTEARYGGLLRFEFPTALVVYEGITLKIPGGRYTPDWIVIDGDRVILCVEVKGAYRFNSAGRSHLAFKAARQSWPFKFRFVQWDGGEWLENS